MGGRGSEREGMQGRGEVEDQLEPVCCIITADG